MLEVFTVGGGEYLVNVFNAVAAWSGGGGYRSLLRVVMVMGLIYSLLVVAFIARASFWPRKMRTGGAGAALAAGVAREAAVNRPNHPSRVRSCPLPT